MSEKVKKGLFTILITLMTISLLFGAYFLYNNLFINQPLSTTLDNSEFITEYRIVQDNTKTKILKIKVAKVENLENEFQKFVGKSSNLLKDRSLMVEVLSNPNGKLKAFYKEIHPAVYEALALGNYTDLQEKIKKEAINLKLSKADLIITNNNLYLQLEDKKNYLYCIFTREQDSYPKIMNNMGSDIK